MKKLLLATAIAALSVSAANAAPTVYGKAFLTLDLQEGDTDSTTTFANGDKVSSSSDQDGRSQLNSNASRIGLKGAETLTANTDLIYKLEFGIDVDSGDAFVDESQEKSNKSDQFYARDTYLGLVNDQYGTLKAGRITAIDGEVDYANVTQGGVVGGDGVLASFDAPRTNNSFAYYAPEYQGIQLMAMYVMDENNDDYDSFDRDAFGIAGKYELGVMNVGASYIYAGDDAKIARISGDYALSPDITLGALYQNGDYDTDDNESAITLSGKMNTATRWAPYAQLDLVTNVGGAEDADAMRVAVGSKYNFNKATIGHVYGAFLSEETEYNALNSKTTTEQDVFGLGAGIEYKF